MNNARTDAFAERLFNEVNSALGAMNVYVGHLITPAENKAKAERAIFRTFAKACGLPIRMKSIRSSDACAKLPEAVRSQLQARLSGAPVVFVAFPGGTSPGEWQHAIPSILAALTECAEQLVD
jgi:hypothetical protein